MIVPELIPAGMVKSVAGYNSFDERLETLVVETRTLWSLELQSLSAIEKRTLALAMHSQPQLASQITYERTHTGFIREVTISPADIPRLKTENTRGEI